MVKGYATPQQEEIEEEERTNILAFEVITGGKEPPSTGNCWLDELDKGCVFTVQDKLATDLRNEGYFILGLFKIADREGKVTYLQTLSNPKGFPINPVRFCNRFDLYEKLGVLYIQGEQEEGNSNGESDRLQGES